MGQTAKLFQNGKSQAVRLPLSYRFEGSEVSIRRDEQTGDVILSRKPESLAEFFAFAQKLKTIAAGLIHPVNHKSISQMLEECPDPLKVEKVKQ